VDNDIDMNGQELKKLIPLTVLSLDLEVPVAGWKAMLRARGIALHEDDIGRVCIRREDARVVIAERREREAERAAQQAAKAATRKVPVPAGTPALEGATPFESLAAAPGYTTPSVEFGRGGRSVIGELLDQQFADGRQQAAAKRQEQALKKAKRALDAARTRR
jgi:hypothetical protein